MAKAFSPKPADIHAANVTQLKERIKSGNLSGTYIFYGEEEYTKNFYYDKLAEACGNRTLNVKTISGSDFNLADFFTACDTMPAQSFDMFADEDNQADQEMTYRLVRLISPDLKSITKKDEKHFLSRIEDPDEGVIIVFMLYADSDVDLTKGLYKHISEAALTVNFRHETKGSPSLIAWILKHFNHAHIEIERSVAMYMSNFIGCDMTTLKNEIDNCINYLKFEGRTRLTVDDVNYICKKSAEAQIFDISSNTLNGDYTKAMTALKILMDTSKDKDDEITAVFALISKAVYDLCVVESYAKNGDGAAIIAKKTGLHEFVVKKNLALLSEKARTFSGKSYTEYASEICLKYDSLSKSSKTGRYELLKEMIFKLQG